MSETERAHLVQPAQPGRRRRRVLAAVLGLSVLCMGTGAFSLAIFTSSASSTGTFAAGTMNNSIVAVGGHIGSVAAECRI